MQRTFRLSVSCGFQDPRSVFLIKMTVEFCCLKFDPIDLVSGEK